MKKGTLVPHKQDNFSFIEGMDMIQTAVATHNYHSTRPVKGPGRVGDCPYPILNICKA